MEEILGMAEQLGQSMARTNEYRVLKGAIEASGDDRELAELQSQIQALEAEMEARLRAGDEPDPEQASTYEDLFSRLQANPSYQRLVAAQANFSKVVARVNETIQRGLEKGAEGRIILT